MTVVLDSFNAGALQDLPTRAGWGTGHWSGTLDLQTDAVPTKATAAHGSPAGNIWAANFTTDHDSMFTYGATINTVEIVGRSDSSSAPSQGYTGRVTNFGTFEIDLRSGATLVSGSGATPAAGDSYRLSCVGTLISLDYRPSGGAWVNILSGSDATYTTGTFIGIHIASTSSDIDEFGGGIFVPTAAPRNAAGWTTRSGGR